MAPIHPPCLPRHGASPLHPYSIKTQTKSWYPQTAPIPQSLTGLCTSHAHTSAPARLAWEIPLGLGVPRQLGLNSRPPSLQLWSLSPSTFLPLPRPTPRFQKLSTPSLQAETGGSRGAPHPSPQSRQPQQLPFLVLSLAPGRRKVTALGAGAGAAKGSRRRGAAAAASGSHLGRRPRGPVRSAPPRTGAHGRSPGRLGGPRGAGLAREGAPANPGAPQPPVSRPRVRAAAEPEPRRIPHTRPPGAHTGAHQPAPAAPRRCCSPAGRGSLPLAPAAGPGASR